MPTINIPSGVQEFLAGCPKAGNGVNLWIFRAALLLHRAQVPEKEMFALLRAATQNCGRTVREQEIERAITNSGNSLRNGNQAERRTPKWPERNPQAIAAITQGGPGLEDLRKVSPVKWTDSLPHSDEVIDVLFPGNPLLCVGQSKYRFTTMLREKWRGRLAARQFIVPSPMTDQWGVTKDGKKSMHTLSNTGPRRFLVIEFDQGTFDEHAAILLHLAQYGPLALAVHSGSKSIHGWFACAGVSEKKLVKFMRYAVSLGADEALWTRSQFCRLPDGRRENGKRQEIVYFDPNNLEAK